jgi:hypothetical protein
MQAFLRFPRERLAVQLADRQEHTPAVQPPQEGHGGHPQRPGHVGDREPEAADADGPDGRPGCLHRPAASLHHETQWLGHTADAQTAQAFPCVSAASRATKSARSRSSRKMARRLMPRTMTWWRTPGASRRGPRGMRAYCLRRLPVSRKSY